MGSILIGFASLIYYQKVADELEAVDRLLYRKAKIMAASVRYELIQGQWRVGLDNVPLLGNNPRPLESEVVYARWYNTAGRLTQFYGMPPAEELAETEEFLTIKVTSSQIEEKPTVELFRQVTLPVQRQGIAIGYLQIATPITLVQEKLANFLLILAVSVPIALGMISFTGLVLGGIAMKPIRESYEQLQRFTANASHELRTPLAAILSNAQAGLMFPDEDGTEQRYRLEQIVELTKSIATLVTNLLVLARHAGRLAPESLVIVDLQPLVQDLIEFFIPQAIAKDLTLTSLIQNNPVKVLADPDLLRQAVSNLLSNGLNYTPAGGKVELRLFTQSYRAVIEVADTGVGIPDEDLPHIFERFYRVHTKRSQQSGGFGLGLAIAKQLVEVQGGHINVTSTLGKGSTFQIILTEIPLL
jgi:signal transduction histidine kinase